VDLKAQDGLSVAKELTVEGKTTLNGDVTASKNVYVTGNLVAGYLIGDGSGVTNVDAETLNGHSATYYTNASNLVTGSVNDGLLSGNVALLDVNNTFSGVVTLSASGTALAVSNNASIGGTLTLGTLGTTDTSTFLCRNSSNAVAGCPTSGAGAAFVQGGNSFGTTALLGTSDAQDLTFRTNGTNWVTISTLGTATFSGARSIQVSSGGGTISIMGGSGGWATGTRATDTSNTSLGYYGFFGNVDTLHYYFVGPAYNTPYMTILNSNGYTNIGGDTTPDSLLSVGTSSQFQVNTTGGITVNDDIILSVSDQLDFYDEGGDRANLL